MVTKTITRTEDIVRPIEAKTKPLWYIGFGSA